MKQTEENIHQQLRRAVESTIPDVLPQILLRLKEQEGTEENMTAQKMMNETTNLVNFPQSKAKSASWRKKLGALAAALTLMVGGGAGYMAYQNTLPVSTISFDVNPSVELKVNRAERVISATPLNEDAVIILSDMDLKNVDLDVAVNALIGSMVKNGYVSQVKNSILISVDSKNTQQSQQLQQKLTGEVNALLDAYSVEGAVLSQTVTEDERLMNLAKENNISLGKAALVDMVVSQDDTMTFAGVAAMPINDINLLIAARQPNLTGVQTKGQASSGSYIGEEKAKAAALAHAGVSNVTYTKSKLDYDDGRMVYDIEFYVATGTGAGEYDYEIDAATGNIVEYDWDKSRGQQQPTTQQPATQQPTAQQPTAQQPNTSGTGQYIGAEKAKSIALNHAGVSASGVQKYDIELDRENGRMVYELDFTSGGMEYEYEIDATSGNVLKYDSEWDD